MDRRAAIAHVAARARRLAAPRSPHASAGPAAVTLRWSAPRGAKPAKYLILRDGRVLGHTAHRAFADHSVKAGRTYRYAIVAIDAHGRRGKASRTLRVTVPRPPAPLPPPASSATPPAQLAPVIPSPPPAPPVPAGMTTAMVDRLFWRAGFGPTQSDRDAWTGRPAADLVDWMLSTPSNLQATGTPPLSGVSDPPNAPADPYANDDELLLEWLDIMQRAANPLPERLAFFWHRHWAISRDDGSITVDQTLAYRERMRRYADFSARAGLSFRDLAWEMTTQDIAMSYYLDSNLNVKHSPNENYAREFMELFCLGPNGPDGTPNYTQADVQALARAFTGWRLDTTANTIRFFPASFDPTSKALSWAPPIPDTTGKAAAVQIASVQQAVDTVLGHPSHAQFLIRKLWAEFIASPIPQATLDDLVAQYRAGYRLRPVLRGILTHPLIFESIGEPNLVKPPVVFMVGVLRQLGAPMKGSHLRVALANMQQLPYRPPNVSGWEGGLAWLNTNTVQGRFDAVVRAQYLKYSSAAAGYPGSKPPDDIVAESAGAAYDRAHLSAGRPWLSADTEGELRRYAGTLRAATAAERRQRFYTLQALMLGGPDGQVM